VLLSRDWIHANGCVPSTLHQCIFQWVRDKVEVIHVDELAHIAVAVSQIDVNGGRMQYLTGCDITDYNYVSVGKEGFMPINVKPVVSITQLNNGKF
jgi:hypothetical protein